MRSLKQSVSVTGELVMKKWSLAYNSMKNRNKLFNSALK